MIGTYGKASNQWPRSVANMPLRPTELRTEQPLVSPGPPLTRKRSHTELYKYSRGSSTYTAPSLNNRHLQVCGFLPSIPALDLCDSLEGTTPCLHSQDLLLSLPFHRASLSSEDADGDLGWNFRAHAIRTAQRQVGTCIRGVDACRNVKLDIC